MGWRKLLAAIVVTFGLGAIAYTAWHFVSERSSHSCYACARPVHAHSKTVAIVGGKRAPYCCPACALSEHQQSGKPVQVVELTDYVGGGALKPEDSYIVRNSDVNHCMQHRAAVVAENKQPLTIHYDRCAPSVIAFRSANVAGDFAKEHGGQVLRFADFASEFQR